MEKCPEGQDLGISGLVPTETSGVRRKPRGQGEDAGGKTDNGRSGKTRGSGGQEGLEKPQVFWPRSGRKLHLGGGGPLALTLGAGSAQDPVCESRKDLLKESDLGEVHSLPGPLSHSQELLRRVGL